MKRYIGKLVSFKLSKRSQPYSGLVISYNEDWTLIKYNPVDYVIDGYALVRNKKINGFRRGKEEIFTEQVVLLKGCAVQESDNVLLDDLQMMLQTLSASFTLLQFELQPAGTTYIGRIYAINEHSIVLSFITPKGTNGGKMDIAFKDIWTIQFDNDYVNSLKLLIDHKSNARLASR